jgi:hypothetical protein
MDSGYFECRKGRKICGLGNRSVVVSEELGQLMVLHG